MSQVIDSAVNVRTIRSLVHNYFTATENDARGLVRLAIADALTEGGLEAEAAQVRAKKSMDSIVAVLYVAGGKVGRKSAGSWLDGEIKAVTAAVFAARKDRSVNPEGEFDRQGRWYPSDSENGNGDGTSVRGPSKAWPYSYMLRCRTKDHCAVLVRRALMGFDVPGDVTKAMGNLRERVLAELAK